MLHFLLLCQVIPGKEQRSIEALCWVGERLFSAGLSGEIIEFDLHNLRPKLTIDAYGGPIWTITPNPQGTHLAVCVYLYLSMPFDLLSRSDYLASVKIS